MRKLLGLLVVLLWSVGMVAQKSEEVRRLEAQRQKTLEEIERTSRLLGETTKSAKSSLERLNLISKQILSRKKVITLLNQEIGVIDQQMRESQNRLDELGRELEQKKAAYAKSVNSLYRRGATQDKLLFILSAESFGQSLRRIRYLREYAEWQERQAHSIIEKREEIAQQRQALEKTRTEKQALLGTREQESAKLRVEEQEQKQEVQELNKRKSSLMAELKVKKKRADELNRQIEKQIAEEIARAEAEARAAEAKRKKANQPVKAGEERVAETKGGYAMTRAERELSGSFVNNKGRLPYPVTGRHMVVGTFGEQQHQELKYVRTNNSGIDIRTNAGADARAVFKGVVTRVFVVPGYNNSVIVRHGNYLTVYSNLSQVYVQAGDQVNTRQALGRIFSDPAEGNATVLHFQLWKEKTKLDPQPWLE
ncbi:MAG TPA: peptidoglycan DD-metalloendopeptidase family protein [Candidatus Parabacteroides intestinipullorum]|uniref:Peptidoglycan DD-metalloendopeptidase family protein n=1 Tax=Candidatus Parabacteroides intestinipullorum TaxID=2838723 RepID=A0A9D1X6J9_9BACT|nr:peptidoglycan DD-metalloendopeptidase family protein [Candidatus Parabacteroides intestinipullorum]